MVKPPNSEVAGKTVTCTICQKKFSRTDHLKRHHLRHSGVKPYSCIFCGETFTRRLGSPPTLLSIELTFSEVTISVIIILDALNAKNDKFQRLPEVDDGLMLVIRTGSTDSKSNEFFGNGSENGSTFSDPFEDEPIDWSLFEDENLLRFLSSPLTDMQMQTDDMFAPLFMEPHYPGPNSMQPVAFPSEWEPPSVQSSTIIQVILEKAISLQITPQEQADIQQHLNFLFTPSKITKFINLYFEFWHPHCPIVHQPTFCVEMAAIPLVMAVTLMGAMYSQADREVNTAKIVLDLAELVIYSVDELTDEFEIKQVLRASTASEQSLSSSPTTLSHLHAAYLMLVVQFWAGSMVSRKRAVETRFNNVVKVARRLGLTKARHELDDSVDESLWIRKESQIRLISTMTLLDCAFSFFANFPCRLTISELRFDLPCEEIYFSSPHPFSEQSFTFSRRITLNEAFYSLFPAKSASRSSNPVKKSNPLGLNPMDMFILIHILYVYTLTHITLFSCSFPQSTAPSTPDQSGTSTPGAPSTSSFSSDTNHTLIKAALSRWRSLWTAIRSNMPNHAWANLGFFRNGYNYWLVTQLLINNKGSADLMIGMEVGCEDTLKQLKGLLREGLGETGQHEKLTDCGPGSARGIGAATVYLLHACGSSVVHGDWDSTAKNLDFELKTNGHKGETFSVQTDVTDYDSVLNLFDTAWKKYGRVDIAISNAGIQEVGNWFDPDLDLTSIRIKPSNKVVDVNLTGTLYFARIAAVYLKQGAKPIEDKSLVLLSSTAGFKETPGLFAYTASKHGVLGLLRSARPYLPKTHNIRINAICPWMTDTVMVAGIREDWVKEGLPVNKPADVARLILEVGSDGESNGKAVFVEGGRGWDIEEGINRCEEQWLGIEVSRMLARGQEVLGDGTDWTKPEKAMADSNLTGKSVIVTGGASGIGLAIVRFFAAQSTKISILDICAPVAQAAVSLLRTEFPSSSFLFKKCDISNWDEQAAVFAEIYKETGRIDYVFANAGVSEIGNFLESSTRDPVKPTLKTVDINLVGTLYKSVDWKLAVKLAVHYMRKTPSQRKGLIVCTASNAGLYPFSIAPMYGTSKHGVVGTVRSLAKPLESEGIRINAICPNCIATGLADDNLFSRMLLTPMSVAIDAVREFVTNQAMTGVTAEISGETFTIRDPPEMIDEMTRKNFDTFWNLGYA
ncbi:15-hydroxyprostaglandin dehydrogenase [Hyphodiscus hymeniophilus]|uniref:15-hydroxyprostaglandin dehydrogenase n=1 Tax=Hyphodiscus hymeniophilus TaxID=353542 RepID=A0A9P6VFA1_9HELO|nr:15-hydroxyprostaglandin dehydrogenase [Hyphodiscus hymeniophilus]